jgi:hypothetical protein
MIKAELRNMNHPKNQFREFCEKLNKNITGGSSNVKQTGNLLPHFLEHTQSNFAQASVFCTLLVMMAIEEYKHCFQ